MINPISDGTLGIDMMAHRKFQKQMEQLEIDMSMEPSNGAAILYEQNRLMREEVARLRSRDMDFTKILQEFGFDQREDLSTNFDNLRTRKALEKKGRDMETLEAFNKANPTLNDMWSKYMMMMKLAGGDEKA